MHLTDPEFINAPELDLYLDTESKTFQNFVTTFLSTLKVNGHHSLLHNHLSAILLNVIDNLLHDNNVFRYSRSNDYWRTLENNGHPNPWGVSPKIDTVFGSLEVAGFVEIVLGSSESCLKTRIVTLPKLKQALIDHGLLYDHVIQHEEFAYIRRIDKTIKKKAIERINAITSSASPHCRGISMRAMLEPLKSYNSFIKDQNIILDEATLKLSDRERPRYKTRGRIYRVFSSLKHLWGGRFYGAWWQDIPKDWRKHILINGQSTIELDYKAQHAYFIYGLSGLNLKSILGTEDPYLIPKMQGGTYPRSLGKMAFTRALNVSCKSELYKSLLKEIKDHIHSDNVKKKKVAMECSPYIVDKTEYLKFLKAFEGLHINVLERFYSDAWKELQFLDSKICQYVLETLTSLKVPCLSIHDSFIVPKEYEALLKKTMVDAYLHHGIFESIPPIH